MRSFYVAAPYFYVVPPICLTCADNFVVLLALQFANTMYVHVCALPDVSPLPASTVPAPAEHCALEALAAYQTTDGTPRTPVGAAEVMSSNQSINQAVNQSKHICVWPVYHKTYSGRH